MAARRVSATAADLEAALGEIRARGVRMTPQRQLILETVYGAKGHVTPEDILQAVQARFRGVNLSTVYRNLGVLEELGYVRHAHLGHTPGMYHPVSRREHQHLVCRSCGAVAEIGIEPIARAAEQIEEQTGFALDPTHFALFGTCRRCKRERG